MQLTEHEQEVLEPLFEIAEGIWDDYINDPDTSEEDRIRSRFEIQEMELVRLKLGVNGTLHPLLVERR